MNEKQYHKLDKIVLNSEEFDSISQWVRSQKFNSIDIPLNECFVILEGVENKILNTTINSGLHFKITNNNIIISQYDMNDMFRMFTAHLGDKFFTEGKIDIDLGVERFKLLGEDYINNLVMISIAMVFDVFQYMTNKPQNITEKKVRKVLKNTKKRSKSTKSRPKYVKIHSNKYIFDINANNSSKKYQRHAKSWSVRGHWRYYKKSGKRVWIDGYIKGDGEIEGKIYKI